VNGACQRFSLLKVGGRYAVALLASENAIEGQLDLLPSARWIKLLMRADSELGGSSGFSCLSFLFISDSVETVCCALLCETTGTIIGWCVHLMNPTWHDGQQLLWCLAISETAPTEA